MFSLSLYEFYSSGKITERERERRVVHVFEGDEIRKRQEGRTRDARLKARDARTPIREMFIENFK